MVISSPQSTGSEQSMMRAHIFRQGTNKHWVILASMVNWSMRSNHCTYVTGLGGPKNPIIMKFKINLK